MASKTQIPSFPSFNLQLKPRKKLPIKKWALRTTLAAGLLTTGTGAYIYNKYAHDSKSIIRTADERQAIYNRMDSLLHAKPGAFKQFCADYGLQYLERYSDNVLAAAYRSSRDPLAKYKKTAIFILNRSDPNGAFRTLDLRYLDHFVKAGFNLILCEASTEREFLQRVYLHGRTGRIKTNAPFSPPYDFMLVGAHGAAQSMELSTLSLREAIGWYARNNLGLHLGWSGAHSLDVHDFGSSSHLKDGAWVPLFAPDGRIVEASCLAASHPGDTGLSNTQKMFARLAHVPVYAESQEGYVSDISFASIHSKLVGTSKISIPDMSSIQIHYRNQTHEIGYVLYNPADGAHPMRTYPPSSSK